MLSGAQRVDQLIARISLWLLVFFCTVSVVAIMVVTQHGKPGNAALRMAIPISVIVSCLAALVLGRRGWHRLGATLVILTAYASIVLYVVAGSYGLHSYLFSIFALLIVVTALLIGALAGLWITLLALATTIALFALERNGLVVDAHLVQTIPLNNILVVYCVLFASVGAVLYIYSGMFHKTLLAVDEQERRVRQVIDASPLGQVVHRDDRILMINKIASARGGLPADGRIGLSVSGFIAKEQQADFNARVAAARALAPRQSITAEYRISDQAGRERLYETMTSPVDFLDGPALLTVMRDVTRERAIAAALADAKTEAESASRAKSQFLANMSHEIRTPMNAVLGLSELLTASGLAGPQLKYAQNIHNAAASLLGVINDVLDVSRIEAGYIDLANARFEPRVLLAQVRAMLLPLAESKGLALEMRVDSGVPAVVQGDEGRLRQILVNLAGNAVKFAERGRVDIAMRVGHGSGANAVGTIGSDGASQSAAATAPEAGGAASQVELQISITDTGIGIAPEKLATLFERFVQVDGSDTRKHGGTGLGLYIARELALRMGGSITVQSLPGVGSSFEVRVRLAIPSPAEAANTRIEPLPASPTPAAGSGRSLAVLLVEDNEINRMVARAMLEAAGHRVTEAVDGAHAVASHAAQPFDCILMDAQMPVMDGVEATRRIRAREAAEGAWHTPIVALTANAMQGDSDRYLAAGMDAFLAKPYESAGLLAVLLRAAPTAAPAASRAAPERVDAAAHPGTVRFDPTLLEGLVRLDAESPGLLEGLVRRFLANTPGLIAQLSGETAADLKQIHLAAHSLRSTCGRFGAVRVSELAEQAEGAAREGALPSALHLGTEIHGEFALFLAEFKQHPEIARTLA